MTAVARGTARHVYRRQGRSSLFADETGSRSRSSRRAPAFAHITKAGRAHRNSSWPVPIDRSHIELGKGRTRLAKAPGVPCGEGVKRCHFTSGRPRKRRDSGGSEPKQAGT